MREIRLSRYLQANLLKHQQAYQGIVHSTRKLVGKVQFDIRFLMATKGFTEFWNNQDTLIAYYLIVVQKVEASKRLSDLAYELTDMGGYDAPLEDYKKEYKRKYIEEKTAEIEQLKAEAREKIEQEHKIAMVEYKQAKAHAKATGATQKGIVKPAKGKMPKFPTKNSITLVNEIDGGNFNYDWIPLELMHPYASGDTDCCLRIYNKLSKRIESNPKMYTLWTEFYPNLTRALGHIEATGVMVNDEYAKVLVEKYTEEEQRILGELRKFDVVQQLEDEHMALWKRGCEEFAKPVKERDPVIVKLRDKYKITKKENKVQFNPSSAPHKGKILYKLLGITLPYDKESIKDKPFDDNVPESELTWEDYRTDKHALGYIITHYPEHRELAETLLEYSKVNTLKNNFAEKLPKMVSNKDFKVHGSFKLTGTETSRLSSKDPNMQQVPSKVGDPKRFDYTYPIKRMFVTSFKNGALLQLDYSALEMRILALVAKDLEMTQAFFNEEDLHKATASILYGKPIDEISPDERQGAKRVNFGLAYGETPFSFAPKYDMSVEEAEKLFDKYFANKPRIKEFIDETHEFASKHGYVDTLQGHRRMLRDAFSKERNIYNGAMRKSVNTIIQGTGAYLTNMSLVYIDEFLRKNNMRSKIVLTVHDSIVIDCPPEEADEVAKVSKFIMENLPIDFLFIDWKGQQTRFPIVADCEIGRNYNDMVDYDKEELASFASLDGLVKFHKDQKKFKDYKEAGIITEEQCEQGIAQVKASKQAYQAYV